MKMKIKKLHPDAQTPRFANPGDAGMDLYSIEQVTLAPGEKKSVGIGLSIEIPKGHVGLIWDKSGVSHKHGIKTLGGVIDESYRGEWFIGLINLSKDHHVFEKGHKIAQLLVQKVARPKIVEAKELSKTKRGKKAFGSTGK